jgi:glycerophosphoryl diester phosphodiesterase
MTNRPLVLGHRGASRRARENTLEAFAIARELGADGVELDVRRTSDGVAVLNHDPQVEGYGLVWSRTFAELRAELPHVPTLAEALDELAGLLVNIELKCLPWDPDADPGGEVCDLVVNEVAARSLHDQVIVSSFDLAVVQGLRERDPRLITAWLTNGQPVEKAAALAAEAGAAWLHPDRRTALGNPRPAIEDAHQRGLRVDVWTVNDPAEVRALAEAGVDAVITDTPDVALDALRR